MIYTLQRIVPDRLRPQAATFYLKISRRLSALERKLDKRSLSLDALSGLLSDLGLASGATVMLHSSMDRLSRRVPGTTPITVIRLFQDVLGPQGTLLMPTFPFLGTQCDYVMSHRTFNPQKTPSKVGLITEIFRRMPDVIRSWHPTHSVSAWGKHARELTASHHLGTAFGENSPLFKLQQHGGLVLGLGAGFRRFTILHVAEELHPKARKRVFESSPQPMRIVQGGTEIPYELFPMRPGILRDYDRVEALFLREGTLKVRKQSGLECVAGLASNLIGRSLELIDRNLYLFPC